MVNELPEMDSMGLAMFDTGNGFNEFHRYQMLWNMQHRWAKGIGFVFNCYLHYNLVIVWRGSGRPAHVIVHKEGSYDILCCLSVATG